MNKKRWVVASLAVFVVAMVLEYIFNNYCLKDVYLATAQFWRPEADMMKLMPYYWVALFVAAFFFTYIYIKGYEAKSCGIGEGFRYGLIICLFVNLPIAAIVYATMPVPTKLPVEWFITGMGEYIILGIVAGLIYKKECMTCCQ